MQTPNLEPKRLALTKDFSVLSDYSAIDEDNSQLIVLHMFNYEQAVKASWANLATSGKVTNFINNCEVVTNGMKAHKTFKSTLADSGYFEMWLIHKQAISQSASPHREPYFYVFVPEQIPLLQQKKQLHQQFANTLDLTINIPILPEWSWYLWQEGFEIDMIAEMPEENCHNLTAFRIGLDLAKWESIVSSGLKTRQISF